MATKILSSTPAKKTKSAPEPKAPRPAKAAPTPGAGVDYRPVDDVTTALLRCPDCGTGNESNFSYFAGDWHKAGDMLLDESVGRAAPDARDLMFCSAPLADGSTCGFQGSIQEFLDAWTKPGGATPALSGSARIEAAVEVVEAVADDAADEDDEAYAVDDGEFSDFDADDAADEDLEG